MTPDISQLDLPALQELAKRVAAAIEQKKEDEKARVLEDMKALAKERGFDFSELVDGKKARKKAAAKYRNPENGTQTWTGQGRKPKWLVEALEAGKDLEDMRIG